MPGKHRVENTYVSFIMDRLLIEKVNKDAADKGMTRNAYGTRLFYEATKHVVLPKETIERVKEQVKEARIRRQMSWSKV